MGRVTREMINNLIQRLNEAENSRPNLSVEDTILRIDAVCAPDFQGQLNRSSFHDREMERQTEKRLFGICPDYHRTIDQVVIDPPFVAFEWTMTGTFNGVPREIRGCSVGECDERGLLRRGSVYMDMAQLNTPDRSQTN